MTRDPKKVLIGMAIGRGDTRWQTTVSLLSVLMGDLPGWSFSLVPGGGCDVAHARNLMFHEWRTKSDAGILVFIDSDVRFGPAQLGQLLRWFENPKVNYCGGLYPLKGSALIWSYGAWSKESDVPGLWEVFELCTGFTAMRFPLLERLIEAHPDSEYLIMDSAYRGEIGYELCAMGPVTREWPQMAPDLPAGRYARRLPEDFYLSMRIRELGETIYVDPRIQLGHVGMFDFLDLHKPGTKELAQGHA